MTKPNKWQLTQNEWILLQQYITLMLHLIHGAIQLVGNKILDNRDNLPLALHKRNFKELVSTLAVIKWSVEMMGNVVFKPVLDPADTTLLLQSDSFQLTPQGLIKLQKYVIAFEMLIQPLNELFKI